MHDGGKIIAGLAVFLGLVSFPFWFGAALGGDGKLPEPKLPASLQGKQCVESKEYMRAYHMDLLDKWRDEAVREGLRMHVTEDGRQYDKSLTNTCLKCHESRKDFCQQCHNYVGVDPYCWDCHVETRGTK